MHHPEHVRTPELSLPEPQLHLQKLMMHQRSGWISSTTIQQTCLGPVSGKHLQESERPELALLHLTFATAAGNPSTEY